MASVLCLAAPAAAASAEARERPVAVDLKAGPLSRSLSDLAAQASVSIGAPGALPDISTPRVKGRMTPEQALARLLAGTRLRALRVGPGAYRLMPAPAPAVRAPPPLRRPLAPPPAMPEPDGAPAPPRPEIVVTALRRSEPLFSVPAAIAIVPGDRLVAGAAATGSRDVAARIEGLTLTNLGAGRNRQFIRGVADSAFNGYSQSTVSIVVDDSRITYDAPDPDLRLVDVARVELLKGPQGPLYGTGALGGVYRIVTNRPDPSGFSGLGEIYGSGLAGGGVGGGGSLTLNLPLAADRIALRASVYGGVDPGWIDDEGGRDNINVARVSGGRIALRWLPADGWTVDFGAMAQFLKVDDSQYVPVTAEAYERAVSAAEPHDNDLRAGSVAVSGPIGAIRLDASASLVGHEVTSQLDASAAAAQFGETGPLLFSDDRNYQVADLEARLSGGSRRRFDWIAGLSWLSATSGIDGRLESTTTDRQVVALSRVVTEMAAYGQAGVALSPELRAELGLRLFQAKSDDELSESGAAAGSTRLSETRTRLSPSLSLAWSPRTDLFLYARLARAERAAGLGARMSGVATRFASDGLTSYELGGRARTGRLQLAAALFYSRWTDIQSDYLLANGLIATHNAGDATIAGGEASGKLRLGAHWRIEAGAIWQRARLVRGSDDVDLPKDPRLPVVPDAVARFALSRSLAIGGWHGSVGADLRYTGASRLSFDTGLDRKSHAYAVLGASASLARDKWTMALDLTNLLGARADTFGFGNPFSIRAAPQFTPLRPPRAVLSLRRGF
ncbi:MAG: hypothetical protein JWO25_2121 [Alphaproteobacteria bacterium]|nr:hypothetical protein [Alphaproteobacteria bacterium]